MDLTSIEIRVEIKDRDIFEMKSGEKFLFKTKKSSAYLTRLGHLRYLNDGAKVRIERIDPETLLVSLSD